MYQRNDFDKTMKDLNVRHFYQIHFLILPICDDFYDSNVEETVQEEVDSDD